MSKSTEHSVTVRLLPGLIFATLIAGKLVSPAIAAWSWWWLLMPLVPLVGVLLQRLGV